MELRPFYQDLGDKYCQALGDATLKSPGGRGVAALDRGHSPGGLASVGMITSLAARREYAAMRFLDKLDRRCGRFAVPNITAAVPEPQG